MCGNSGSDEDFVDRLQLRVIGLRSSASGPLDKRVLVFSGGQPGTCTVYPDNLRIRHADGSTSPLWTNGKDTRTQKVADTEIFQGVQVRTVRREQLPGLSPIAPEGLPNPS